MVIFRCTQALRRHLKPAQVAGSERSSTRLGDWYANRLFTKHYRLVIFVSEPTFLTVLVPLHERVTLIPRFREALYNLLVALAVPPVVALSEIDTRGDFQIAPTASRRVLGMMNDLMFQARVILENQSQPDLHLISLAVSRTPCSPLQYSYPDAEARQLLLSSS